MRRRLVVLRHAKSAWPDGVADHDRPLAGRGRREAPLAGRWLAEHVDRIDLVVCSSAVRARQTWERAGAELGRTPETRVDERVYAASERTLLAVVRELPDTARTVLLIGHNPGLEDLVEKLCGVPGDLRTSAIAVLSGRGDWVAVTPNWARLDATVTPRP
jgi:phosphohistidine phosphatase